MKAATRKIVLSHGAIDEALDEMARALKPKLREQDVVLIGIRRRGVPLAERLREKIFAEQAKEIPLGTLDITLYRDDLSALGPQPVVGRTEVEFPIDGRTVVLVDDVLHTGRTIRAALDALIALGRPKAVRLAVLIDRGHREYPIRADAVGRTLETEPDQSVQVMLSGTDPKERVLLLTPPRA